MAEIPDRPHRTGAFWLDFIVAAGAVIISLISLWVAQRSDSTQERLLAASVWPYVQYGTSNDMNRKPEIQMILRNAGVGPALIRWMTVEYGGRSVKSPYALLRACCEKSSHGLADTLVTSSVTHSVLVPHEVLTFLAVDPTKTNTAAYKLMNHARDRVHVRVCYCSVLHDCWLFDNNSSEEDPKPMGKCPPTPDNAYDD